MRIFVMSTAMAMAMTSAVLADDNSRLCGVDRNRHLIRRSLDLDPGNTRVAQVVHDHRAQLDVLVE